MKENQLNISTWVLLGRVNGQIYYEQNVTDWLYLLVLSDSLKSIKVCRTHIQEYIEPGKPVHKHLCYKIITANKN